MPVDDLIPKDAHCPRCGGTIATGCDCWIEMTCPVCSNRRAVLREKEDPCGTESLRAACDECFDETNGEIVYLDADGNVLESR